MPTLQKINLWTTEKIAAADPAKSFQPYMSLYLLPGEDVRGMVLVCPGGGYHFRAPHEGGPVAQKFNAMGFHAAVVEYRVAPYVYPEPQQDILRAVKLTRAYASKWNVNPDKIAVLGFSAGGHLACSSGILFDEVAANNNDPADKFSARPDATILCYPVITGIPANQAHRGSFNELLGHEATDEEVEHYSWQLRVKENTPPSFIWHTAEDDAVPIYNSLSYASALAEKKIPFELHVYPHGNHGLGLGTDEKFAEIRSWSDLCGVWLRKQGF